MELKTLFNPDLIGQIGDQIRAVDDAFDRNAFVDDAARDLDDLELKQRSAQICTALITHLPEDFDAATSILLKAMGEDDGTGGVEGFAGFRFMPFLDYVAERGLATPEAALDVMEKMTIYFSGEFAIRPFLLADFDATLRRMNQWAAHEDWRVRRLASEGSRPRLPWAGRIPALIDDPSPARSILDALHDDPHLVVRRSVANHLNDIAKDHPDKAVDWARPWNEGSGEARWTVKHGMRTLIKQGHPGALELLGFRGGDHLDLQDFTVEPNEVAMGETVEFRFELVSREQTAVRLAVDYALHRVLKSGRIARKVFKLAVTEISPGETLEFNGKQSFRPLSTRTYYPGTHGLEILVNGRSLGRSDFELLD